jgi:hypothetical protein
MVIWVDEVKESLDVGTVADLVSIVNNSGTFDEDAVMTY